MKPKKVWQDLCTELLLEEHLLNARLTPISLARQYRKRLACRVIRKGKIVAFGTLWKTYDPEWLELGTLWVHPSFRGRGLVKKVFDACVEKKPASIKGLLLVTHSARIASIARALGWAKEKRAWTRIECWKNICRPWDRYPDPTGRFPSQGILYSKTVF